MADLRIELQQVLQLFRTAWYLLTMRACWSKHWCGTNFCILACWPVYVCNTALAPDFPQSTPPIVWTHVENWVRPIRYISAHGWFENNVHSESGQKQHERVRNARLFERQTQDEKQLSASREGQSQNQIIKFPVPPCDQISNGYSLRYIPVESSFKSTSNISRYELTRWMSVATWSIIFQPYKTHYVLHSSKR